MSTNRRLPLQNRVAPDGEILTHPARGLLTGNRGGKFHRDDKTLGERRWAGKAWIACVLEFKGRRRDLMGDSYTELFFLDEATALSAGHRPCFECRRAEAVAFGEAWARAHGLSKLPMVKDMDAVLHAERLAPRDRVRLGDLPDGAMIKPYAGDALVWESALYPWSFNGYGPPRPLDPDAEALALTPACVRAVLAAGYRPMVYPSAAT